MAQAEGVAEVTDQTFSEEVLQSPLPVLVDFTASWCAPCRTIAPVLEDIAAEKKGELKVVQVDVDSNPRSQEAYGVLSMPTLMVFRDGEPVRAVVGSRPKRRLLQELADVI